MSINPILLLGILVYLPSSVQADEKCRKHLGCWKDVANNRAINITFITYTEDPIKSCQRLAAQNGFPFFAVQNKTECFTAADAGQTYKNYGRSERCDRGYGGVLAQDVYRIETCKTAQANRSVDFDTERTLRVILTEIGSEEKWNGDVIFLAVDEEVLIIGLHPETHEIAVGNGKFTRGTPNYDYRWVKTNYPTPDADGERQYRFRFTQCKFELRCRGEVLISISYEELTEDKAIFLSSINKIKFKLEHEGQESIRNMRYFIPRPAVLKASPEAGGEVLVQLNKNITLSCNINRKEQITWAKDQQVINRTETDEQQDSTSRTSAVTIERVTEADQGEYSCKSRGLSASFSLKTFDIEVTSEKVAVGAETTLTCRVSGISSTLHFEWTDQNSIRIENSTILPETDGLQKSMITITPTENTFYTCNVTRDQCDACSVLGPCNSVTAYANATVTLFRNCSDISLAWTNAKITPQTPIIEHNTSVKISCDRKYINLGTGLARCYDGNLMEMVTNSSAQPNCVKPSNVKSLTNPAMITLGHERLKESETCPGSTCFTTYFGFS